MQLTAPAKINLFFRVVRKRADGYHDIESLYQAIDLFDRLFFELSDTDSLTCSDPYLPCDETNLVIKALRLFRTRFSFAPSVKIHIEKKIPMQAGLGGGSSDAAATLLAINQLSGYPATEKELIEMGSLLGSDVPFFFSSGTAYCTGRGEILKPVVLPAPLTGWIAKPPFGLSTPAVYQNMRLDSLPKRDDAPDFFNDLEFSAFQLRPELASLKKLLQKSFRHVTMTGSGTAFFCLEGTPELIDGVSFFPFRSLHAPDIMGARR